MKPDDMLLEQRLAISILTAECDRLQARNEKLEKVARAAYRTTATSFPHTHGCRCIDCLLIQALADLGEP